MYYVREGVDKIDWRDIALKTKRDEVLSKITKYCTLGWPNDIRNLLDEEKKVLSKTVRSC